MTLKKWRGKRGWTQRDVAEVLDVHPHTVNRWERLEQDYMPSSKMQARICTVTAGAVTPNDWMRV